MLRFRLDSRMAWRIHHSITRGEFDFTVRGKITGVLWLAGSELPVTVKLEGLPSPDLAGHRLVFVNPIPEGEVHAEFPKLQKGVAGDMTASRKVKVIDEEEENIGDEENMLKPFKWHWANSLYLEWYSESSGRVVIESVSYSVTVENIGTWQMEPVDEECPQLAAQEANHSFLDRLTPVSASDFEEWLPNEEEPPASEVEAEAEAENKRMEELMDRVNRRLKNIAEDTADVFLRIYEEEREKLRIERGEPEPEPMTEEEENEYNERIDDLNRAADEAMEEWANNPDLFAQYEDHPLVDRCKEFYVKARRELIDIGINFENDSVEHPLCEWVFALQSTTAKLAGALNSSYQDRDWPPNPIFAGSVLVRLKKARALLRDAHLFLQSAAQDEIVTQSWLDSSSKDTLALLASVEELIREVREALEDG